MNYFISLKRIARYMCSASLSTVLLVGSFFLIASPVQASGASMTSKQASPQNSVTVLILDMSGSMKTNDLQGYRCSAANAFIDMSGSGNYIGVIGLDGDGTRGGPHNFALAQQWTPDPVNMDVVNDRNSLKSTIQQKSQNCRPDGITPTYDALNKALHMLEASAQGKEIPGSVILLTDGEPNDNNGNSSPDVATQINAITSELLPQFRQHSWPIDTIALGQNAPLDESGTQFATFHDFLQGVSNSTTGKFYDDAKGVVPGITSLNIAPFFADIFARYNHRTVQNDIGVTSLNDNLTKRNFNVTPYTSHLDIVVTKDNSNTTTTLKDANNQLVTQQKGISIYKDPYYMIFSIDNPQSGIWELDVQGTGQFMMESLKRTTLNLAPLAVSQGGLVSTGASQSFASGQPLTIKTSLANQGSTITDTQTYTVQGTLSYNGVAGTYSQDFALHGDPSGTYTGTITVQNDKPTGSYQLLVRASTGSLDNILESRTYDIRIGQFPLPLLLSSLTGHPTQDTVTTQVIQWDPLLHFVYSLPLPDFFRQLALQGHPVGQALMKGQVTLNNQAYNGATINANVTHQGTNSTSSAQIQDDRGGNFHLQFPITTGGLYTIHFTTSGTFADTHGDFGETKSDATVIPVAPNLTQEGIAWFFTLLYICGLICLINFFRYFILAHPTGGYMENRDGEVVGNFAFKSARRNPFQLYFRPNLIYSRQAKMPAGLLFRFKHHGGIEVQPHGSAGTNWQSGDGGRLRHRYQEVRELRYYPKHSDANDEEILNTSAYTIKSKIANKKVSGEGYGDDYDTPDTRLRSQRRPPSGVRQSSRAKRKGHQDNYDDFDY